MHLGGAGCYNTLMAKFKLHSPFKPTGDQPQAIKMLTGGVEMGLKDQVLLGVTGSGKTFTMANIIQNLQRPTLVISHNKTLAAQLAQEFREFFPQNAVEYFVSYYDYYQPEAYVPQTDTYIAKETEINELIDKLRLSATTSLLTRQDVIVVASVSCIYNIGSPLEYGKYLVTLKKGHEYRREALFRDLIRLRYERNDLSPKRGMYAVKGESISLYPSWMDDAVKISYLADQVEQIVLTKKVTGSKIRELDQITIYPAKHYVTALERQEKALSEIQDDLAERTHYFTTHHKLIEAQRIEERTNYDLEMIRQVGYCSGVENYSRYFDGRKPGEPPYTLLDYFPKDYLLIIDESHITVPQIRGMYFGDRSRKQTLIDFGFRLPSASDNRPLKFSEFWEKVNQAIYTSATPEEYELKKAEMAITRQREMFRHSGTMGLLLRQLADRNDDLHLHLGGVPQAQHHPRGGSQDDGLIEYCSPVEQLIRPTGILDPEIEIRKTDGQIEDLLKEIGYRVERKERVLVTTLTKRMAEDLTEYLENQHLKVQYIHADVETLKRTDILEKLRRGEYDVLVGINLLREGLDLPEVSLVAIMDADKEGFLRSQTSLIQVMGRAARHLRGKVIMYADTQTGSMKRAIKEIDRRRKIQLDYNQKQNITPTPIVKSIRQKLIDPADFIKEKEIDSFLLGKGKKKEQQTFDFERLEKEWPETLPAERKKIIRALETQMRFLAKELLFEEAARIRDEIRELGTKK